MNECTFELSRDVLENIVNKLEYPEVSALRSVNKEWNEVCCSVYQKKRIDICKKIKKISEQYKKTLQELHGAVDIIPEILENYIRYVETMYEVDWCMFVHDLDFMENIFQIGSELHVFRHHIDPLRYNSILEKIRPFLYMDDAHLYPLLTRKRMCIFKGVKGYNKMNKAQICRKLKRPINELYYFKTEEST